MTCLTCLEVLLVDRSAPERLPYHLDGNGLECLPSPQGVLPKALIALTLARLRDHRALTRKQEALLNLLITEPEAEAILVKIPRSLA